MLNVIPSEMEDKVERQLARPVGRSTACADLGCLLLLPGNNREPSQPS